MPLSKVRERNRIFPLNRSRMIKIALGVYDTLEITMGARSPTLSSNRSLASRSGRLSGAIDLCIVSVTPLDARRLPTFN